MEPAQAAAELATIRTLMERAALYRRALAPMTLAVGAIGAVTAVTGLTAPVTTTAGFAELWCGAAVAAVLVAFFVVRRQSLQASEPLWTPPTRRVFAALAPALCLGGALAVPYLHGSPPHPSPLLLAAAWMGIYGLGLNAAGFFMPRGIRWFGFAFVALSAALIAASQVATEFTSGNNVAQAHGLMGVAFGLGHLAYGMYLRITERPADFHAGDNSRRRL